MAYEDLLNQAGQQFNVDPALLRLVMGQESDGNPSAVSPKGASGLMQLMPGTAQEMGVTDIKDPKQNIFGGAKYLSAQLDKYGDVPTALAAYNAGPGAVDKHGGIPPFPETQAYVRDIVGRYKGGSNNMPQQTPQMPGLPPTASSASAATIDPFAGLTAAAPAASPVTASSVPAPTSQGMVDPFAGLDSSPKQASAAAPAGGATGSWGAPVSGPSFGGSVLQGLRDTANSAEQLGVHSVQAMPAGVASVVNQIPLLGPVSKMLGMVPAQQMDRNIGQQEQQYAASRAAAGQTGIDWGRGVGNAVSTAPLALAAPETAGMSMLAKTGVGAVLGGANAALAPVTDGGSDYWAQKGKQVGLGATVGAIAAPVASSIGSVISGAGDTAQQLLAKAGVTMTPGQILGGGWKATEDKLTSIPVLGDLIKNAQQRSVQSFNKATYNEVLAPLGQKFEGDIGNDGVAAVQKTIGNAYDSALSKMTFNAQDQGLMADLGKVGQMAQALPESQRQQFTNIVQNQITGKLSPQGTMTGETLKGVQSELSRISRGYSGDASFDTRQLGAAIGAVKDAIDNSLPRYNPPEAVQGLQAANAAYANFARLRGAAASQGAMNNGGVFTAGQLNNAVRGADKSVGKGATATGNALMQDFSTAGQSVLGNTYPDSGTAGRSLLATVGGLGAAALAGHEFVPPHILFPAAGAIGLGALPYTATGQKLTQGLLMSRPEGAQAVGNAISRYGAPLAPSLFTSLLQGANR